MTARFARHRGARGDKCPGPDAGLGSPARRDAFRGDARRATRHFHRRLGAGNVTDRPLTVEATMTPELLHIPYSPWSEKARWALDARAITYRPVV